MQLTLILIKAAFILTAGLSLSTDSRMSDFTPSPRLSLETLFPSAALPPIQFDSPIIASPLLYRTPAERLIIVATSNGKIAALNTDTGTPAWQLQVPTPNGQQAELVATPVIVDDKLVVIYQCLEQGHRISHRLAVIDLTARQWDRHFPVLTFAAEKPARAGTVKIRFNPPTAYSHAALKHAGQAGSQLGTVYASFGNAGDTQPFHGWLFAVDLDDWQRRGVAQAIKQVWLTTPETECPVSIESGTQEMICGGGIWSPPGPQIYPTESGHELLVPTGNGQIDLNRGDYANALLRIRPGSHFDPECDAGLCARFDPVHPDEACLASCKNLFIPRPIAGEVPLQPAGGECDGKSYWECLAWMDYDLGASAPAKATLKNGRAVLIQPGKDGSVFLIDADHLGTLYDRLQIADLCGTVADPCKIPWAGMIVTQPVVATINATPIVIIPTFVPDKSHPAGLVALKIVQQNGSPKFQRFWQFPDPQSVLAIRSFRSHPSLPILTVTPHGNQVAWIVDIDVKGHLYAVNVKDGKVLAQIELQGTGRPLSAPVIDGQRLYLTSMLPESNRAILEAFTIAYE